MLRFIKYPLVYIFLVFAVVYSLISIVNHYCFRTYALDLGVYTNALYDYLHFHWNDSTVFKEVPENLLADHFDLYLILFSPLSVFFETYTLLIIQIAFVLIGAYGVFQYFEFRTNGLHSNISYLLTVAFLFFFGIYSALSYDYHSNVVASMLVPYLFLNIRKEKWMYAFVCLVVICVGKENMALWMCFVLMGLLWEYRSNKDASKKLILLFLFSLLYFILITKWVMPSFSNSGKFLQFNYSVLGKNFSDALLKLITQPFDVLKLFFINHTNDVRGNYVKLESHIFIFISGLWVLLFKPNYIFMLLPLYAQKMLHDDYQKWSIDAHYSVEFAPLLIIGAGEFILSMKKNIMRTYTSIALVLLNLLCTIRLMDKTIMFTNKSRYRIYQSSHYQRIFNIKNVYDAMLVIPEERVVSAQTSILPHLALRDKIYTFPIIKDAEYIILNLKDDTYPLDTTTFKIISQKIINDSQWEKIFNKEQVYVLRKKQ